MKNNSAKIHATSAPIASAIALFLINMTISVHAQQAGGTTADQDAKTPGEPVPVEQVVITGIRGSLQQALEKKRGSDLLVEVISAEDIGKLPDKNVADAIQRLPGVNTSSSASGEGGFSENDRVSIRGTSASLTQLTVNGHMISTGDWFVLDQSGAVGRSVSYALLPSEIVSSVTVQKSQQADMLEGGVAGSVNIETRRPLDFKQQLSGEVSLQAIYADLPERTDPQVNALINWKNDANTFGIFLQGFSEDRHERRDGQEFYGYTAISPTSNAAIAHPDLSNVMAPNAISSSLFEQTRKRTGGDIDLEIKPSSDLMFDLNGFSSNMNASNYNRSFYNNIWGNIDAVNPTTGTPIGVIPSQYIIKNGTLVSAVLPASQYPSIATANPVTGYNSGLYTALEEDIYRPNESSSSAYLDFDGSYRVNNHFKLTGSLGYTRGVGSTPEQIDYLAGLTGSGSSYQTNGLFPASLSFPGVNVSQFANMVSAAAFESTVETIDTEKYGQLDGLLSLDEGIWESAKFGLRYAEHERNVSIPESRICLTCNGTTSAPLPSWNGATYPANFGSGLNSGAGFLSNIWQVNPTALQAWANEYVITGGGPNTEAWPGEFNVLEKDTAAYAMTDLSGSGWRGNFGLRFTHTDQATITNVPGGPVPIGLDNVYGPYTPTLNRHSYNDILPSTNFKFDLSKNLVARVAIAKTMARADYSALAGDVSLNDNTDKGSSGNPNLKPVRSTNYNTALEWYFAPKSLLSANLFFMDMSSYITYGTTDLVYYNNTYKRFDTYGISSPTNIAAQNRGIELSYQQALWGGFGLLANFTLVDGTAADGLPVVGNSKDTYNLEAYYENAKYSARVAYTYRSSFYGGLYDAYPQVMAGTGSLAASLSYKINDRLSLTFDGLNLNNPLLRYYGENTNQPIAFYSNGRQFFLGLRAKL
jgi:iron complex outermembrane receptor protein